MCAYDGVGIRMADGSPFVFAGVWERWQSLDGEAIESCAIATFFMGFSELVFGHKPRQRCPLGCRRPVSAVGLQAGQFPAIDRRVAGEVKAQSYLLDVNFHDADGAQGIVRIADDDLFTHSQVKHNTLRLAG